MSILTNVVVYNGRLLSDESTVDFVLWAHGRDFEILAEPDATVLAAFAAEDALIDHPRGRDDEDRDDSVSGWFVVPDPA
jgi:hypothetical protein